MPRRLYTVQIPAIRAAGFVILCVIALLQGLRARRRFRKPNWLALLALNLAYATLAWLVLRLGHGRSRRLDLSLLLFHVDVLVWLPTCTSWSRASCSSPISCSCAWSTRRGTASGARCISTTSSCWPTSAIRSGCRWPNPGWRAWTERLGIAAIMYLLGLYLASTGVVAERLRRRSRDACARRARWVERLTRRRGRWQAQAVELEAARRQAEQASLASRRSWPSPATNSARR